MDNVIVKQYSDFLSLKKNNREQEYVYIKQEVKGVANEKTDGRDNKQT